MTRGIALTALAAVDYPGRRSTTRSTPENCRHARQTGCFGHQPRHPPPQDGNPCSQAWPTSNSRTSGCAGRTSASPPACLKSSARKSSAPAASGTPTKATSCGPGSPNSSSSSSTCASNSKSEPTTSTPRAPPTATSWPWPTGNPPTSDSAPHLSRRHSPAIQHLTWEGRK